MDFTSEPYASNGRMRLKPIFMKFVTATPKIYTLKNLYANALSMHQYNTTAIAMNSSSVPR